MLKKIWSLAMLCLCSMLVFAQGTLKVHVFDDQSKSPLSGASVQILGTFISGSTDSNGQVSFKNIPAGNKKIQIRFLGFENHVQELNLTKNKEISVYLEVSPFLAEAVLVTATRANEKTPTTYTNLNKTELAKNNLGQDLPFLLGHTPSVVVTSDAGAGVGYTGLRIRGSDASRINVTINGIPLNNPESLGAFLINLPDLASSVENVQIQRGIGTSTNGAGAFGASLNIQSADLQNEAYAELDNSYGSYNTLKNTVRLGTGLINNHFSFDGRLSQIKSDGYIDRATSDLKSFFLTGAYHGKNSLIKANIFSGKEKTYQAWNGVPEDMLETNRKYNEFEYENQTDNYTQTHYQLHFSQKLAPKWHLNTALHYTRGAGYYEEYKDDQSFNKYGMENLVFGTDTIRKTDLIRRRWLDNHFYGLTYSLSYKPLNSLDLSLGGAYNEYYGAHYGEVIWAKFASNSELGDRYYEDDAEKKDFNIFGKAHYNIGKINLFGDLQYRRISYQFLGFDRNLNQLDQTIYLNFFNPKVGLSYQHNQSNQYYISIAQTQKEPDRDDYTESSSLSRSVPEKLTNLEAGYRFSGNNTGLNANIYGMWYDNQLIPTGQINDVGYPTRVNVAESYRMGLELDGFWKISSNFIWSLNASLSENKIKNFVEYIEKEGADDLQMIEYPSTNIAFSPAFVGANELNYIPFKNFEAAFISKFVGRQYLDNTSSKGRSLDPYFVHNLRFSYNQGFNTVKNLGITLAINNIFSEKYSSNGYTFGYLNGTGNRINYNYYYPQATANFMLGLNLKF